MGYYYGGGVLYYYMILLPPPTGQFIATRRVKHSSLIVYFREYGQQIEKAAANMVQWFNWPGIKLFFKVARQPALRVAVARRIHSKGAVGEAQERAWHKGHCWTRITLYCTV